jgi:hypothetical protein
MWLALTKASCCWQGSCLEGDKTLPVSSQAGLVLAPGSLLLSIVRQASTNYRILRLWYNKKCDEFYSVFLGNWPKKKIGISEGLEAFPKSRKSYVMSTVIYGMPKSQQSWVRSQHSPEIVESGGRKMKQCRITYGTDYVYNIPTVPVPVHTKRIIWKGPFLDLQPFLSQLFLILNKSINYGQFGTWENDSGSSFSQATKHTNNQWTRFLVMYQRPSQIYTFLTLS